MNGGTPICCCPEAHQWLVGQLDAIDSAKGLLRGSVAIARHAVPDADPDDVDRVVETYANTVRDRVRTAQPQALVAHLHELLFEEEGFAGNAEDYYNPQNSFVPAVLKTRRGLPATLSLIYKAVASELGLRVDGINLPGHFIVSVQADGPPMLIDPFSGGRLIHVEEARQRLIQVFGDQVPWSEEFLRPATHRLWLTRLLQNLLNIYGSRGQYRDVAAMLELEMVLWPGELRLQKDLALVLARCGMSEPARVWLDRYLASNPDDPQKQDLKQLLRVLTA